MSDSYDGLNDFYRGELVHDVGTPMPHGFACFLDAGRLHRTLASRR